jgi:hypothetical protein
MRGCESQTYSHYKSNCRRRGVRFKLSRKDFLELIKKRCFYCDAPPKNIVRRVLFCFLYQGIDRMDNSRPYEKGNVVPCCGECNSIKGENLSHVEMIAVAQLLLDLRGVTPRRAPRKRARGPRARAASRSSR